MMCLREISLKINISGLIIMSMINCENLFKKAEINPHENILEAFDKLPFELPQGCRSGSCGVCAVHIKSGAEFLSPALSIEKNTLDRLFPSTIKDGKIIRLACRATLIKETNQEIRITTDIQRG